MQAEVRISVALGYRSCQPHIAKLYRKTPLGFNYYSLHYHSSALIQGLHCLPFRLHHLHYSMVEADSSNVRVIITHWLAVRILRKFAVINEQPSYVYESQQNLGRGLGPRKTG